MQSRHQQPLLPCLPLPQLNYIIKDYLENFDGTCTGEEFSSTRRKILDLASQRGDELHKRVALCHEASKSSNWLLDMWLEHRYLRVRNPLYDFASFHVSHLLHNKSDSLTDLAAWFTAAFFNIMFKIERGEVRPLTLGGNTIDNSQLHNAFRTVKEPHGKVDHLKQNPKPRYCIVLRRGHAYKMDISSAVKEVKSSELKSAFQEILRSTSGSGPAISVLTADHRDAWSKVRSQLNYAFSTNMS